MQQKKKCVLGIDLGTTHVKGLAVDSRGQTVYRAIHKPQLYRTEEGHYEQDPEEILTVVKSFVSHCQNQAHVEKIAFSAAMHSFLVVDDQFRPITRAWTWMDRRAQNVAREFRQQELGKSWYRRTGCPVHAMSPAMKWMAFSHVDVGLRPVALRDWIFYSLTHTWATDYSVAAASGLMTLEGEWDHDILTTLHLDETALPPIHTWDYSINDIILGGSDGAMAHYGLNVHGSTGVLTWGTSAAIRVTANTAEPEKFVPVGSFAYYLGPAQGYLIGQALSNAGNVLAWAANLLGMAIPVLIEQATEVLESRDSLPVFVPYLFGERSPLWDEHLTAQFQSVRPEHHPSHFAGAVIVSLLGLLRGAYKRLAESIGPLEVLHVGSNLSQSSPWGQLVSQLFPIPLVTSTEEDGSSFGAAKLAAELQQWDVSLPSYGDLSMPQKPSWRLLRRVDENLEHLKELVGAP